MEEASDRPIAADRYDRAVALRPSKVASIKAKIQAHRCSSCTRAARSSGSPRRARSCSPNASGLHCLTLQGHCGTIRPSAHRAVVHVETAVWLLARLGTERSRIERGGEWNCGHRVHRLCGWNPVDRAYHKRHCGLLRSQRGQRTQPRSDRRQLGLI
jgi:hypothetical protein